ncbi:hypothetical protein HDU78_006184, partial [Chytriomyces hyalinus]
YLVPEFQDWLYSQLGNIFPKSNLVQPAVAVAANLNVISIGNWPKKPIDAPGEKSAYTSPKVPTRMPKSSPLFQEVRDIEFAALKPYDHFADHLTQSASPVPTYNPRSGTYILNPDYIAGSTVPQNPGSNILNGCFQQFSYENGGLTFANPSCGASDLASRLSAYFPSLLSSPSFTSPYYKVTGSSPSQIQISVTQDAPPRISSFRSWKPVNSELKVRDAENPLEMTPIFHNVFAAHAQQRPQSPASHHLDRTARIFGSGDHHLDRISRIQSSKNLLIKSGVVGTGPAWVFTFDWAQTPPSPSPSPSPTTTIASSVTTTSFAPSAVYTISGIQQGIAAPIADPYSSDCISHFYIGAQRSILFDDNKEATCGPMDMFSRFSRYFDLSDPNLKLNDGPNGTSYVIEIQTINKSARRDTLSTDRDSWRFLYSGTNPVPPTPPQPQPDPPAPRPPAPQPDPPQQPPPRQDPQPQEPPPRQQPQQPQTERPPPVAPTRVVPTSYFPQTNLYKGNAMRKSVGAGVFLSFFMAMAL